MIKVLFKDFAFDLQRQMTEKGDSQSALAIKLGVSYSSVGSMLRGYLPGQEVFERLESRGYRFEAERVEAWRKMNGRGPQQSPRGPFAEFALDLERQMGEKGDTWASLAAKLGVHQQTVSCWLRGLHLPRQRGFERLEAHGYECEAWRGAEPWGPRVVLSKEFAIDIQR